MCVARLVCNCALVLVRMSHPSTAACQDVPSFVRWPVLCVSICLVCNCALVLVRMSHPSTAACQDVPSLVRWPVLCVSICLVCIRDLVLVKMSVVSGLFYTCVSHVLCAIVPLC